MKETNPLFVLAESAMTKKEIFASLYVCGERFIQRKGLLSGGVSRQEVVAALYQECDRRHWADFQRKKMVERVASKVCRKNNLYQKRPRPPCPKRPRDVVSPASRG